MNNLCVLILQHCVLCCAFHMQRGLHYHLHVVQLGIILLNHKRRTSSLHRGARCARKHPLGQSLYVI